MGKIKILDMLTANKIAAGEIIERPVSVVKELIENSLDANASYIEVEIKDGGLSLIRVRDNGHGMDEGDAQLAFERHATSKINSINDIHYLSTFGFRGEALPSIAAVSQLVLKTYDGQGEAGVSLKLVGGKLENKESSGTAQGTVIEVWNLFFNTPARRKYIKNLSYESGLISELITKYSLGHENIRFKLINNGETVYDTAGNKRVINRLNQVFGEEIADNFIPVEKQEVAKNIFVEGWLARPKFNRNTKSQQIFFINGRLVKSTELNKVLEQSYHTLLPKGRFAIGLLRLQIPSIELDVNIHPAKLQVKINNFEKITKQLIEIFKDKLWNTEVVKEKDDKKIAFFRKEYNDELLAPISEGKDEPRYLQETLPLKYENRSDKFIPVKVSEETPKILIEQQEKEDKITEEIEDNKEVKKKENVFDFYPLAQLNNSFILAQDKKGLYIIDQHTCHERILYERYMSQEDNKEVVKETLLVPISLILSGLQEGILLKNILLLNSLGFVIESFGPRTYLLRSKPIGLDFPNIEGFFLDLLEELASSPTISAAKIKEKIIVMASCKGAVKAKQQLTLDEMKYLISELNNVKNPHTCPHGRPIIYHLSMQELYKIFKRGEYPGD